MRRRSSLAPPDRPAAAGDSIALDRRNLDRRRCVFCPSAQRRPVGFPEFLFGEQGFVRSAVARAAGVAYSGETHRRRFGCAVFHRHDGIRRCLRCRGASRRPRRWGSQRSGVWPIGRSRTGRWGRRGAVRLAERLMATSPLPITAASASMMTSSRHGDLRRPGAIDAWGLPRRKDA
jgi:hypothetical protein